MRTAQHFWGPQDAPVLVPSVRLAGGRGDPHPTPQQPPCGPCRQAVLCQSFPSKALVWESRCFCREGAQGSLGPQGRGWSLRLGHWLLRVSRQGQLVLGVGAEKPGELKEAGLAHAPEWGQQGQALPGRWWAEAVPVIPQGLLLGRLHPPRAGTQALRWGWPPRADVLGLGGTARCRRSCVHRSAPPCWHRRLLTSTLAPNPAPHCRPPAALSACPDSKGPPGAHVSPQRPGEGGRAALRGEALESGPAPGLPRGRPPAGRSHTSARG